MGIFNWKKKKEDNKDANITKADLLKVADKLKFDDLVEKNLKQQISVLQSEIQKTKIELDRYKKYIMDLKGIIMKYE